MQPKKGYAMSFAEVQGASLFYEVYGQGPAIVFAPGLGAPTSALIYWQQVPHFGSTPCES